MKAAGVDGLAAPIDANTEFAVVKGLRQAGGEPQGGARFHWLRR